MFKDGRGKGSYDIFPEIAQGQINVSHTYPGVVRAFHRHKRQTDNWYCVAGDLEVVVAQVFPDHEHRPFKRDIYYLNGEDDTVLKIAPGLWHGFRVLGNEPATLLYWTTEKYDPDNPDEERLPWNQFYDWKTQNK